MPKQSSHSRSGRALRRLFLTLVIPVALTVSSCSLIGGAAALAISLAPLKLMFACLPEGTQIDTPGGTQAIETLRAGDLVIGYDGTPVEVQQIHGYLEDAENTDFYEITFSNGAQVDLCGMHRIADIRARDLEVGTRVGDSLEVSSLRTYRGVERSYDILTADKGYQIGGVPVNSMIEEMYKAGRKGNVDGALVQ